MSDQPRGVKYRSAGQTAIRGGVNQPFPAASRGWGSAAAGPGKFVTADMIRAGLPLAPADSFSPEFAVFAAGQGRLAAFRSVCDLHFPSGGSWP